MQIKLKSKVDAEGKLFLQLPQQLANQELVIIITDSSEEKIPTPEELLWYLQKKPMEEIKRVDICF